MHHSTAPAIATTSTLPPIIPILEVCIDNLQSGINAQAGGAGRIELCSSLAEGGLTPSVGFLKMCKTRLTIPIFVMIRPRGGDFCYSEDEIKIMEEDLKLLKSNGADGFVFGILNESDGINTDACYRLLELAAPLPCTFHRAFDEVPDQFLAMQILSYIGHDSAVDPFARILTSGQAPTAEKGAERISKLVTQSCGRITIMAGAGITASNVKKLLEKTDYALTEVHGSFRTKRPKRSASRSTFIPDHILQAINKSSKEEIQNLTTFITDKEIVQKVVGILKQGKLNKSPQQLRKPEIGVPTNFEHHFHAGINNGGLQFHPNVFGLSDKEIQELNPGGKFSNHTKSAPATPTGPPPPIPYAKPRKFAKLIGSIGPGKPVPLPRTMSLPPGEPINLNDGPINNVESNEDENMDKDDSTSTTNGTNGEDSEK